MKNTFVTITGISHYYGTKPFKIGNIFKLVKEENNPHDSEAIRAELPMIDTIGYVANSTSTVYGGTSSAGRLYDKIDDQAFAQTMFITHSSIIALVLNEEEVEEINKTFKIKEENVNPDKTELGFKVSD